MAEDRWKSQAWWKLPVYTGDVSGVCSALYELGGMVIMHDPSGCNSTFNTHDEIRWTQRESLIFLSGLTQMDAITGNDAKLIDDTVSAAQAYAPAFIAIANSPVPWLIGTDFHAICAKIMERTRIPAFHVETNAMHDYTRGAGLAFFNLARMLFSKRTSEEAPANGKPAGRTSCGAARNPDSGIGKKAYRPVRVNILGMTPLDFTRKGEPDRLRKRLEAEGFEVVSVWAMNDRLENLKNALSAEVNLVVSSTGIYAARWMEERFGIPYTAGIPAGGFADVLFRSVRQCAAQGESCVPYAGILAQNALERKAACGAGCFAGEPVMMGSLAAARILEEGENCDLIPLTETVRGLIPEDTVCPKGEEQIRRVLGGYDRVTADPMLREACRDGCRFEELPHFALSGRMFL